MNEEQKQLLKEATTKKSKYFEFEEGKRKNIVITGFEMIRLSEPDDFGRDLQFKTKIQDEDGNTFDFETTSTRFITAVMPFIEDKEPTELVQLKVKRIGSGTDIQYDVE